MFLPYTSADVTPCCRRCKVATHHFDTFWHDEHNMGLPEALWANRVYRVVIYECPKCKGCQHTVDSMPDEQYLDQLGIDVDEIKRIAKDIAKRIGEADGDWERKYYLRTRGKR